MAYVSEEGIILRRQDYFDTDQLISLLTPTRGVLNVRVPHGQKSQKTHCGRLEPPNQIQARLYQSKEDGPWTLSRSEITDVYADMMGKEDLRRQLWPLISLFADLFPEGQAPGPSYQRLRQALKIIREGFRPALLVSVRLLVKTAEESGIAFDPHACRLCGTSDAPSWTLSPELGLRCPECDGNETTEFSVTKEIRETLVNLSEPSWSAVKRHSYSRSGLEKLEALLYRLFHYHFEISLEALEVRQVL